MSLVYRKPAHFPIKFSRASTSEVIKFSRASTSEVKKEEDPSQLKGEIEMIYFMDRIKGGQNI
jgi:hypothetical protein